MSFSKFIFRVVAGSVILSVTSCAASCSLASHKVIGAAYENCGAEKVFQSVTVLLCLFLSLLVLKQDVQMTCMCRFFEYMNL